jgi:hypothetical protein
MSFTLKQFNKWHGKSFLFMFIQAKSHILTAVQLSESIKSHYFSAPDVQLVA